MTENLEMKQLHEAVKDIRIYPWEKVEIFL